MEFRLRGAQALQAGYPELVTQIVDVTLKPNCAAPRMPLRSSAVLQALAEIACRPMPRSWRRKLGPAAAQITILLLVRRRPRRTRRLRSTRKPLAALPEPLSPSERDVADQHVRAAGESRCPTGRSRATSA